MNFRISESAANQIKKLFNEQNESEYRIRVFCRKVAEQEILYELTSIEKEEHHDDRDLLIISNDIKVSLDKNLEKFFDNVILDYKEDTEHQIFYFYKVVDGQQ